MKSCVATSHQQYGGFFYTGNLNNLRHLTHLGIHQAMEGHYAKGLIHLLSAMPNMLDLKR